MRGMRNRRRYHPRLAFQRLSGSLPYHCRTLWNQSNHALITPETSEERVREIDAHTDGFIYMVSSAATTGAQQDFNEQKRAYFKKIEDMNLRNPLMVGFGISNKATFQAACEHASGAIIGSRFVTLLEEEKDPEKAILKLKDALK